LKKKKQASETIGAIKKGVNYL